ncbi:MAG TPA: ABC transporter permease [Gaiellaceae bacterium]|jgi:peptide/nickel transport system permease protein
MLTFIIRRLLLSIPVLVVATFLIFVFVSVASNPLAQLRMNPRITKEEIATIAHAKKLDRPVVVRYGYWVRDAVLHKFGVGLTSPQPIWPTLKRVIGHTLQLLVISLIFSLVLGVAIGIYSAVRQYSVFDYTATTFSFIGFAMPVFWAALILQVIFTDVYLHWHVRVFYTAGLSSPDAGSGVHFLLDRAQHLALPVIALSLIGIAGYSRYMRASMLEVINADYTRTARAKGLPEYRVIGRHVFRNALIPLTTQVAIDFGALFAGAVVTEQVFTLDGMGHFFLQALSDGDPYPIMAWLVVVAVMVIIFNLIADILYGVLDPRIRYD